MVCKKQLLQPSIDVSTEHADNCALTAEKERRMSLVTTSDDL